ncbi:MAG TPA: cytochrome B [Rhodobacteraceae bacterium]|jgi:cytochrome b|nr:cytochrome B [Paracoccaceae bacterium]
MKTVKVWDPLVRLFHWSLVSAFAANALLTDDESKLHQWVGYAVIGLVAFRILWGLIGTRHARFSDFLPSISGVMAQLSDMAHQRPHARLGHTPLGALMIYNLLLTMIGLGLTGWMMTTNAFWGVDWVEELHETLVTWAWLSVAAHVAGVVFESVTSGVNLVGAMISGRKILPDEKETTQ